MHFRNRREAGKFLAEPLAKFKEAKSTIVLGIPRGGVPVAYEVAKALHLPLDVFVVRKLGYPGHEELAMGAIASGGICIFNEELSNAIPQWFIDREIDKQQQELHRREQLYHPGRELRDLNGKTVIVVDDGLATGASMLAAVQSLRRLDVSDIIVAVPVGARETCARLKDFADEVICGFIPNMLFSVGAWYDDFAQTSDEEVAQLLNLPSAWSRNA